MSKLVRNRVVVSGRVQGVGFRYYAQRIAHGLRVSGFVRNLPDLTVEAEVQGLQSEVSRFLDALRIGPPGSRVYDLRSEPLSVHPEEDGFEIRA